MTKIVQLKQSRNVPAFVPDREVLSPLEKSEIGVKRLREAVVAVRASKGEKASY